MLAWQTDCRLFSASPVAGLINDGGSFPFGDSATAVRIMRSTSPTAFGAVCRCLFTRFVGDDDRTRFVGDDDRTRFVGDDDRGIFATVVVCAEVSRPFLSVAGNAETD
jgi:hypothetical protein